MDRVNGTMGAFTITSEAFPIPLALTLHLSEQVDYQAAMDELSVIVERDQTRHRETHRTADYLSLRIHRWAIALLLEANTVAEDDHAQITRVAHQGLAGLKKMMINPLDRSEFIAGDEVVLGADGWAWKGWLYRLCRDLFEGRSPFDLTQPMLENPPQHLLIIEIADWVRRNLQKASQTSTSSSSTASSSTATSSTPTTSTTALAGNHDIVVLSTSSGIVSRAPAPQAKKLQERSMTLLVNRAAGNEAMRESLRALFIELCNAAWERRMHEEARENMEALRVHVNQRTDQMEARSEATVREAREVVARAEASVQRMLAENRETQERTARGFQERIDAQNRAHQEWAEAQNAQMRALTAEQTAEAARMRDEQATRTAANIQAIQALQAQQDNANQIHAAEAQRLENQLAAARREQAAAVVRTAELRQETATLGGQLNTERTRVGVAEERVRAAEERNRLAEAQIGSLGQQVVSMSQQLQQVQANAGGGHKRRCVVS